MRRDGIVPGPAYEISYLQNALQLLEKYLLSGEMYWPIRTAPPASAPPFPSLTLGGLLLSLARLNSPAIADEYQAMREQLRREIESNATRWRVAWEGKALREFHARLTLWRDFLDEYRSSPENHTDRYAYEVNRRVMLDLLEPYTEHVPEAEKELLRGLDQLLRASFTVGGFVLEAWLEPAFPAKSYWYLYGNLRESK